MVMDTNYKNPSATLRNMVSSFATTFQGYMKNSAELLEQIRKQADKEGIPKEQLRKIIEEQLTRQGLAKSSIRRILPADLKNQNMVRKRSPKKEPLVKEWEIDIEPKFIKELCTVADKKAYIVHDNKRVVDVGFYE